MSTAPCRIEVCGARCHSWRQCPMPNCGHEVAFCDDHGGDKAAVKAMLEHVAIHVENTRPMSLQGFDVVRAGDGSAWNITEDGIGIAWSKSKIQAHRIAVALAKEKDGGKQS